LADREDPKAGDKVISVHDPDARCGNHHGFYDGYLADVTMDGGGWGVVLNRPLLHPNRLAFAASFNETMR
jgi:hypothetical protein